MIIILVKTISSSKNIHEICDRMDVQGTHCVTFINYRVSQKRGLIRLNL